MKEISPWRSTFNSNCSASLDVSSLLKITSPSRVKKNNNWRDTSFSELRFLEIKSNFYVRETIKKKKPRKTKKEVAGLARWAWNKRSSYWLSWNVSRRRRFRHSSHIAKIPSDEFSSVKQINWRKKKEISFSFQLFGFLSCPNSLWKWKVENYLSPPDTQERFSTHDFMEPIVILCLFYANLVSRCEFVENKFDARLWALNINYAIVDTSMTLWNFLM